MGDEARRSQQLAGIQTATETSATNSTTTNSTLSSIYGTTLATSTFLSGDVVGARKVTAAATYDDDGGLSHVEFDTAVRHVKIYNRDTTNYVSVVFQPTVYAFKAYLTTGTGGTDGLSFQYKTGGTTGNSYQVAIVVAGTGTALSVVETSATLLTINSATDGGGTATSTPQEIKAACDALNSGAGPTYVDVWAWGVSAVSAAGATNLANGALAGAGARASEINQVPTPFWGKRIDILAEKDFEITTTTALLRVNILANTAACVCDVVASV